IIPNLLTFQFAFEPLVLRIHHAANGFDVAIDQRKLLGQCLTQVPWRFRLPLRLVADAHCRTCQLHSELHPIHDGIVIRADPSSTVRMSVLICVTFRSSPEATWSKVADGGVYSGAGTGV